MEEESGSISVRRMEKVSKEFVVENYSLHREDWIGVGKEVPIEEFDACGHRWSICLFPGGKHDGAHKSGSVSLYVALNGKGERKVELLHELCIVDQSGKGNHQRRSLFDQGGYKVRRIKPGQMVGYDYFMKRESLESSDYGYLKHDCLRIRCTVGVFTCHNHTLPPLVQPDPPDDIGSDFGKLLTSKLGADVVFKLGNESIWAHKWILIAHSPVFRSTLLDCHRFQEILVSDMDSTIFQAMLCFIYTGTIPKEEQEAVSDSGLFMHESFMGKMLAAADKFEVKELKKICESRLSEEVSSESFAYLLHLANLYHAKELKSACLRFAAENQDAAMKSEGCEYLKETCPSLFLELVHYMKDPITILREKLDLGRRMLFGVKECIVDMSRPWGASDVKHKIKEA